jgi:acyl-CoA dehydrogenase
LLRPRSRTAINLTSPSIIRRRAHDTGFVPEPHRIVHQLDARWPFGITIEDLRLPADQMLGTRRRVPLRVDPAEPGAAVALHALVRRRRARRRGCYRLCSRRRAFGKTLIDHEGVGFMLADNMIDLKQAELMIEWCPGVLDSGDLGTIESSMAKVAVSEALSRVADRRPDRGA